jgi:hypothetical protein
MQCILTKTAYGLYEFLDNIQIFFLFYLELFYAGESIPYRTIVSLTCPYCSLSGFIPRTLLTHCLEKHPIISSENETCQIVVWKIFSF